jgi:hypothetical protein
LEFAKQQTQTIKLPNNPRTENWNLPNNKHRPLNLPNNPRTKNWNLPNNKHRPLNLPNNTYRELELAKHRQREFGKLAKTIKHRQFNLAKQRAQIIGTCQTKHTDNLTCQTTHTEVGNFAKQQAQAI